jgi:hypothetical protein
MDDPQQIHTILVREVRRIALKVSSRLMIGSGLSRGDHVSRDVTDTCYCGREIPASQSSRWYDLSCIDVTFLLPILPLTGTGADGVSTMDQSRH